MDEKQFNKAIAVLGWRRRDRWHVDTGDHTLVRVRTGAKNYERYFAFLLRRKAIIDGLRGEVLQERKAVATARRIKAKRRLVG